MKAGGPLVRSPTMKSPDSLLTPIFLPFAQLYKFMNPYDELMGYCAQWVVAGGGTLLVCMAVLNVMQRRPKNRFAWGYSLARTVIGCLLIILGGTTTNGRLKDWFTWMCVPV